MPSSIALRCAGSSTTCMCEHGMNHAVRPPECMSITTSAIGKRTRREEVGELLVRRPVEAAGERAVEVRAATARCACSPCEARGRDHRDHDRSRPRHLRRARSRGRAAARRPGPRTRRRGCRPRRAPSARRRSRSSRSGRSCSAQPPVFVIFGYCEAPDLLAGGGQVDRARDGRIGSATRLQDGRDRGLGRLEQAVDVGVGVGVREVAALQVQRQLEDRRACISSRR